MLIAVDAPALSIVVFTNLGMPLTKLSFKQEINGPFVHPKYLVEDAARELVLAPHKKTAVASASAGLSIAANCT